MERSDTTCAQRSFELLAKISEAIRDLNISCSKHTSIQLAMPEAVLLSIVVPVYNTERYLRRCLDSIVAQKSSHTFEVVAVNDNSSDRSLEILEGYRSKLSRLKIVSHASNRRVSEVRKTGIRESGGQYIMQLDSDDWIPDGAIERIGNILLESPVDVVIHNYCWESSKGTKHPRRWVNRYRATDRKRELQKYFLGAPWTKIARRSICIDSVTEDCGINHGEDVVYCAELFVRAKTFLTVEDELYTYCANAQSLTARMTTEDLLSNQQIIVKQLERIVERHQATYKEVSFIAIYLQRFLLIELFRLHVRTRGSIDERTGAAIRQICRSPIFGERQYHRVRRSIDSVACSFAEVLRTCTLKETASLSAWMLRRLFDSKAG